MTDVKETFENAAAEARSIFAMDSPVINVVVGILILYLAIYFITFYLGPVLFGLRPYHPVWPYFRSGHNIERRSADLNQDGENAANLSAKVISAIENQFFM